MMTGYYLIVDNKDPNYDKIVEDCRKKHLEEAPWTILSIAPLKNDQVLIKVKYGNQNWLDQQSWKVVVATHYTPEDKDERISYYESNKLETADAV